MKKYIKILLITLGIQIVGLVIEKLLINIPGTEKNLAPLGAALALFCFSISIVVDIVLSVKWGSNIAQKLIYIFLMPTNYTLLIFILWAFWVIGQWMEILSNLPPNFG